MCQSIAIVRAPCIWPHVFGFESYCCNIFLFHDYTFHSHTLSNKRCFFHSLPVREYFETPTVKALEGKVDLIVTDPPWAVLLDSIRKNVIKEDRVFDEDIKATAEGAAMVLKPETGELHDPSFFCLIDPPWNVIMPDPSVFYVIDPPWNVLKRNKWPSFPLTIYSLIRLDINYDTNIIYRYHLRQGYPLDRWTVEICSGRSWIEGSALALIHGQDRQAFW